VGVLVPAEEQQVELQAMWRSAGVDAVTACASPYSAESEVAPAVERLIAGGAELLVMDCMGYRPKLKQTIREKSDLPVMLANTTVARIAAEVLGC
jgi:protein AroM